VNEKKKSLLIVLYIDDNEVLLHLVYQDRHHQSNVLFPPELDPHART